jgi:hypothetical protein
LLYKLPYSCVTIYEKSHMSITVGTTFCNLSVDFVKWLNPLCEPEMIRLVWKLVSPAEFKMLYVDTKFILRLVYWIILDLLEFFVNCSPLYFVEYIMAPLSTSKKGCWICKCGILKMDQFGNIVSINWKKLICFLF